MFCKSRGVCFARFHIAKDRADRVSLFQLHSDLGNLAFARRRHTHHGFVGFDLNNFLIVRNFIAGLYLNIDICGFGDRFAQLEAAREPFARSLLRWVDGPTKDLDDKGSVCLSR